MGKTDSAHPELEAHGSFEHLKLGRSEMRHDPRTLRLAKYLDDAVILPAIPEAQDWAANVPAWPMYGNDRLGDCTIAAAGHLVQAWTTAAGSPVIPDEQAILQAYMPGTGDDDSGRVEVDVLNYWRKTGIAGHQIVAYAYVDAKNLDHMRAAIYLFGGVYVGINLPKTAQGQAVWDLTSADLQGDNAPGSWGGHAVPYVAYRTAAAASDKDGGERSGFKTITWGAVLALTDAFHLAYCDEAYVPISLDFLKDGMTPAGFDVAALSADLQAIAAQQIDDQVQAGDPSVTGTAHVGETIAAEPGVWDVPDPNAGIENLDANALRTEIDTPPDGTGSDYYWQG